MKLVIGNLWNEEDVADVILVTTNSYITNSGKLVMGRGAAREAAERYSSLPYQLARMISLFEAKPYGVILLPPQENGIRLGAFQVKHHWRDQASLDLIQFSTNRLRTIANAWYGHRFALNYPGIGNGRLDEAKVFPIIQELPDNVFVYKRN